MDEYKNPLVGASIAVKGRPVVVLSGVDGSFTVNIGIEDKVLQVSYIGMLTQHIPISDETRYLVYLQEDVAKLNEVIVVGYGTVKKADMTGSIESVKADGLTATPAFSVTQMLQGRVPGLYINSHNQDPGSTAQILLRGVGSLTGSIEPLVVINGFPSSVGGLNSLNPNDIEQIDVLKDASATAIYGSRGANGVIIVTTKRGQKGEKIAIDYSAKLSTETLGKRMEVMNAEEYIRFYYDLAHDANFALPSLLEGYNRNYYPYPLEAVGTTADTDWQKELTQQNQITQDHSISLSGGVGNTTYRVAASYFDGRGIVKPYERSRINTLSNIAYNKGRFSFSGDFLYSQENRDGVRNDYIQAIKFAPTVGKYDETGALSQFPVSSMSWYLNPFYNEEHREDFSEYVTMRTSFAVSYEILKGLKIEARAGYERYYSENYYYYDKTLYEDDKGGITHSNSRNLNVDLIASYARSFGKHNVTAMAATNYFTTQSRGLNVSGTEFSSAIIKYYNINSAFDKLRRDMSSNWSERTIQSFLSRLTYDYDNRYYLTVNYRIDGATQFGDENKFGHFPSAALAWRVSNEKFFHWDYINNLKLKVGYGFSGNASVPAGRSQALIEYVPVYLGGKVLNGVNWQHGFYPNPALRWEGSETLNVGVELGSKHFYLDINGYNKRSYDLLLERLLPAESGYNRIMVNKGGLVNYGIEARADGYIPFLGGTLFWTPSVWFAYNYNEVTQFDGSKVPTMAVYDDDRTLGYAGLLMEGYPMGALFGYDYEGVWQEHEVAEAAVYNAKPGDPKFRDTKTTAADGTIIDGPDGKIDDSDKRYLGNTYPAITMGFSSTLKYKNWSLNFMFDGVFNKKVVNYTRLYMLDPSRISYGNLGKEALSRWTPDHPDTDIPSLTRVPDSRLVTSTFCIQEASFMRLRELTLAYQYDFKDAKILRGVRVSLTGTNLFTITDYMGLNPDIWGGVDYKANLMPIPKFYTLGVNLMF
jgi:TonB-linked SusC/RagA family outer membrane protein